MKKWTCVVLLYLMIGFALTSCGIPKPRANDKTDTVLPSGSISATAEPGTTLITEQNSHELLPYPMTTAVSTKDQKATDWMRNYLQKNKTAFDLIANEALLLEEWSISIIEDNSLSSYRVVPKKDWEAMSQTAKDSIEAIGADFRKEFGQDIIIGVSSGVRDNGRRTFGFSFEVPDQPLFVLLSFFPDGYAYFRDDTPYVDFGDGWYFYCGDWG